MIALPPRDLSGIVEPHDHPEIADQDGVIRRISELWIMTTKDGNRRISSMAFKASSGEKAGMSVDLEALIVAGGEDAKLFVTSPRWMGSVIFTAGALRAEGFVVGYHPLEEQPPDIAANPYHGEVWGDFHKSKQRRLAELASWYVPIPGVAITVG